MKIISKNTRVPIKIWKDEIDRNAEKQIINIANMPFVQKHVAIMSDVHLGKGATIGSVILTENAIMPSAVGVDIGCGMSAVQLPIPLEKFKDKDSSLRKLRSLIENSIPVGFSSNKDYSENIAKKYLNLGKLRAEISTETINKSLLQIGTLGGGNHFIELCEDTKGNAWLMLHSGSRNIGNKVASYYIDKAKGLMKQMFISLPDMDLAYLVNGTTQFDNYIHDLMWCQKYAKENRNEMVTRVLNILKNYFDLNFDTDQLKKQVIDCHHNYVAIENHFRKNVYITRKGAVRARKGDFGIIPGSMGQKSFIVEGLGNLESFCSCSHGAGRQYSRTETKKRFTVEDLENQTLGVECRKDAQVIDEIPAAYNDIDDVMKNQKDLVKIKFQLKQFLCVKG